MSNRLQIQQKTAIVEVFPLFSNESFVVCLYEYQYIEDEFMPLWSPIGVNLVKAPAIGKVGFVGFFPTTKGLLNGEQLELGELLGVFGLGLG